MLSNPTNLHQRQRKHRRQQSTPTAFEVPKVPSLPNIQTNGCHRRGISLDQRARRQPPTQGNKTVSTTNYGFKQTQQHILQEAQQQRLACPGQQQHDPHHNPTNDENYLISPLVSPQGQNFDTECLNSYGGSRGPPLPYSPYSDQINTILRVEPNDCSRSAQLGVNDPVLFPVEDGLPSPYLDFSGGLEEVSDNQCWGSLEPSTRPSTSRRVSDGIADRVATFEDMAAGQSCSRPITPQNQNASNYFPPTPATTPFNRGQNESPVPQRFLESYDTSMEETIRPGRSKSNQRTRTIFQEMRDQAEMNGAPSPSGIKLLPASSSYDSTSMPTSNFMNMSNLNLDFMKHDPGYESSHYSPATSNLSPQISQQSSPEISQIPLFGDPFESKPQIEASDLSSCPPSSQSPTSLDQGHSPMAASPPRQSVHVDNLNLVETITDTGITIDDITCYIDGPDPADQKWSCLYPECKKRFGRKENIKSHVQTHLGDRQYQCPHCKKCFVRQHDLKRHAKIHSGIKPYPCLCGNSFARHDALTRHRQRGMCIGAFEGVVKKVVKRGRPRKNRPDTEERLEKASRTRSKNKAVSSASSTSAYSESSYGHSPSRDFDIINDKPFRDLADDFSQSSAYMDHGSFEYSSAPSPMPTDYVSPQAIQNAPSPSAFSTHSHHSHLSYHSQHGSIDSTRDHGCLPALPASPAKSVASHYNTPPELCLSSSSPPPSNQVYDASQFSDTEDMGLSKLAELQNIDISDHDDDMFFDSFGTADDISASRLEQDPSLLLMGGKFDDAFGEWDSWS